MPLDFSQLNWGLFLPKTGFTAEFISEELNIPLDIINQFIKGEKRPTKEQSVKIAKFIDICFKKQLEKHQKKTREITMDLIAIDIFFEQVKK